MRGGSDSRATILVVEDIEDILELVRLCLEGAGYEVVVARDGEEALSCAAEQRPDLAIVDLQLPRLDGYEVTRALRQREGTSDIPVMLLSAYAHDREVERGFEAGADDYLRKPFNTRNLLDRVGALLAGDRPERSTLDPQEEGRE
jgi:DNA-binding response OmpR family regulator